MASLDIFSPILCTLHHILEAKRTQTSVIKTFKNENGCRNDKPKNVKEQCRDEWNEKPVRVSSK